MVFLFFFFIPITSHSFVIYIFISHTVSDMIILKLIKMQTFSIAEPVRIQMAKATKLMLTNIISDIKNLTSIISEE